MHHSVDSSVFVAAVVVVLAGCTTVEREGMQQVPGNMPGGSGPLVASAPPCALQGTQADTCIQRGQQRVCYVYVGEIGIRDPKPYVFPHELLVKKGPVVIVWRTDGSGPNYSFDNADGPLELKSNAEFADASPATDADGNSTANTGRNYRIKFLNSKVGSYKYTIQYQKNGRSRSCDPRIISEGG